MKKLTTFLLFALMVVAVNGQSKRCSLIPPGQSETSLEMKRAKASGRSLTTTGTSSTLQNFPRPVYAPTATASTIFSENFESGLVGEDPTGWATTASETGGYWRIMDQMDYYSLTPHSGSLFAYLEYGSSGSVNDAWMFSPAISLTAGSTYVISFWIQMEGDGDYENFEVKIGNTQSAAGMTSDIFPNPSLDYLNWTQITATFTPTTTGNYYLGFHDYTPFSTALYVAIDDILIETLEAGSDAGVIAITSPTAAGAASATVSATIKNFATETLTSMDVSYQIDNNTPVTESFTGSLTSLQTTSFSFTIPIELADFGTYTLKVWTELNDDLDNNNDTTTLIIDYQSATTLYGYNMMNNYFLSYSTGTPNILNNMAIYDNSGVSVIAGDYMDGVLYTYTAYDYGYYYGWYPEDFVKFSEDYSEISSTSSFDIPSDITSDHSTGTMYAITWNTDNFLDLKTVDLETGEFTLVGNTNLVLVGIACNTAGELYGVATSGNFYSINKATGTATLIGNTGFTTDTYFQSMAFDHSTGRLFWAAINAAGNATNLVEIDPSTGIGSNLGSLGTSLTQIVAMYTPYINLELPEAPTDFTAIPDAGGALSCELSWKNPEYNVGGEALEDLIYVIIERDGIAIDTIENPIIGGIETWTDTNPTNGVRTYTIYGTNSAGTGPSVSQTVLVGCVTAINTFPWDMGFEGNGTNIPDCWTQEQISGTTQWTVVSSSTGIPATSHSGTYKARYYSEHYGDRTKLITPKFDLTGLSVPVLKFWHTQQLWVNDQDTLRIYYKASATDTWTLLQTYSDNLSSWTERTIVLPNPSDEYYIAFDGTAEYGRGVQLDDIIVRDAIADATVLSVNQPTSAIGLSNAEIVEITVKNLGDTAIVGLPVTLEVDDVVIATETITPSIAPNAQYTYTFTATADLSAVQTHTVKVYATLTNDVNVTNDTVTKSVITSPHIYNAKVVSILQPNSGISLTNQETVQVTVENLSTTELTSLPIVLEVNGTVIATETILAPILPNATYTYTFTATADLSAIQTHIVKVYTTLANDADLTNDTITKTVVNTASVFDASVIYVLQPNSGANLTSQETVQVIVKNFSNLTLTSLPVTLEVNGSVVATETITASIAPETEHTYTFTAKADLSAIQTHIVKVYTTLANDIDLTNDTITKSVVNSLINIDASVLAINQPVSSATLTHQEIVQIVVKNLGDNAITSLPVKLEIDGTVVATETISSSIAPNAEASYTFTYRADLSAIQAYTLKVYTTLSGDIDNTNDTATKTVEHYEFIDAGVTAITSPTVGGSDAATVTVTLKNFGNTPVTSMPVLYRINDETPVEETFTGNLESGATANFTFNATVDLSVTGNYTLKAYTKLTGDEDNTNDTTSVVIAYTDAISDFWGANIKLYPNPTVDNFTIENASGTQARIYDMSGKLLLDIQIQDDVEKISIEQLSSGIYFIELQDQQSKLTRKLIKQ